MLYFIRVQTLELSREAVHSSGSWLSSDSSSPFLHLFKDGVGLPPLGNFHASLLRNMVLGATPLCGISEMRAGPLCTGWRGLQCLMPGCKEKLCNSREDAKNNLYVCSLQFQTLLYTHYGSHLLGRKTDARTQNVLSKSKLGKHFFTYTA